MNRRSQATLLGFALLLVSALMVFSTPMPFVIYQPGPTFDLLAKTGQGYIVRVTGAPAYRDTGALRMLTVSPSAPDTTLTLPEVLTAWLNPDDAVYRYHDIYLPTDNADVVQEQGAGEMVQSQDAAVALALKLMHRKVATSLQVDAVLRGGPADGALEVHDQLTSVDGVKVSTPIQIRNQLSKVKPGRHVRIGLIRAGKHETVRVGTTSMAGQKGAFMRISIAMLHDFPFQVNFGIDPNVGGPSAGMMFTLATYDTLTPGSLTGGGDVAGTGTVDGRGRVGAIGGIEQKIAAAHAAGAQLFLAPAADCDEVRGGSVDPGAMRITKVSTVEQALHAIEAWRTNHNVRLPAC